MHEFDRHNAFVASGVAVQHSHAMRQKASLDDRNWRVGSHDHKPILAHELSDSLFVSCPVHANHFIMGCIINRHHDNRLARNPQISFAAGRQHFAVFNWSSRRRWRNWPAYRRKRENASAAQYDEDKAAESD